MWLIGEVVLRWGGEGDIKNEEGTVGVEVRACRVQVINAIVEGDVILEVVI